MSTELLHCGANERRHIMLDKLGGKEVLQKATDIFYDRQLADPKLARFFRGSEISILKWHQFNLMGTI
jgi:truncated hemoglobin YjbI